MAALKAQVRRLQSERRKTLATAKPASQQGRDGWFACNMPAKLAEM